MRWDGETWLCRVCSWVNAIVRKRCRNCGAERVSTIVLPPSKEEP
jgi:hypothetical protein